MTTHTPPFRAGTPGDPQGSALQNLDRRSREIFRRIVESYLDTGEPVGSRNISRILPVSLSPASVRNVMADLEQLGLVYAPHTSAGRLPTDSGLRFFVDALLEVGDLSVDERRQIGWVRDSADVVIDTSALSPHQFKQILTGHFSLGARAGMRIAVMSFSYRRGVPREADLVFDVRFLKNPHYVAELKPLSGVDRPVVEFIAGDPDYEPFIGRLEGLIGPLLPRFDAEGKSYLTIAVGCTGGRHRSIAVAERLADWLRSAGRSVTLMHRDTDVRGGPVAESGSGRGG